MGERQKGKLTTGLEYFYWKSFCYLRLSDVVHLSGERRGRKKTAVGAGREFQYFPPRDPDYVGVLCIC